VKAFGVQLKGARMSLDPVAPQNKKLLGCPEGGRGLVSRLSL
jgi:hypothetical protein